jgi:hypothetical protein
MQTELETGMRKIDPIFFVLLHCTDVRHDCMDRSTGAASPVFLACDSRPERDYLTGRKRCHKTFVACARQDPRETQLGTAATKKKKAFDYERVE